jgi:hypothetical protein
MLENRVLWRIPRDLRGRKPEETGEDCKMKNFTLVAPHQILFERSNQVG